MKDYVSFFRLDEDESFKFDEELFYPPEDDRIYISGVDDIDGGDNFVDYTDWFYDMYGDDAFGDGWDEF